MTVDRFKMIAGPYAAPPFELGDVVTGGRLPLGTHCRSEATQDHDSKNHSPATAV